MKLRFFFQVSGSVSRFVNRSLKQIAESVRQELRERTPGAGGHAASRWMINPPKDGAISITNRAPYLKYLIRGTGLYGPHHQKIMARKKTYLSWDTGSDRVFARSVRGIRPMPFVRDAVNAGVRSWRQKP